MKKTVLSAASLALALSLSACGGSDSKSAASASTSASSASTVASSSRPSSSSSPALTVKQDAAHDLGVKPTATWSVPGKFSAATETTTLVTSLDSNSMTAYRTATGAKVWSKDFMTPPADAGLSNPQRAEMTAVGTSVLVGWTGTASDGKNTAVAMYSIDTGQQIGSTMKYSQGVTTDQSRASELSYILPDGETVYEDGSTASVALPSSADSLVGGTATQLLTASKGRALVAGLQKGSGVYGEESTQVNGTAVAVTPGFSALGKATSCKAPIRTGRQENSDEIDSAHSPNEQWMKWGSVLVNLKTGEGRCLVGISDKPGVIETVTDAGDVWGEAGGKGFVLKHGQPKVRMMKGAYLPSAVVPGGMILAGTETVAMFPSE